MAKNTFYLIIGICIVFTIGFLYSGQRAAKSPVHTKKAEQIKTNTGTVYTSKAYGFSIDVPEGFSIDDAYTHVISPEMTTHGVKFTIPESLTTGTNLGSDSYVSVESIPGVPICAAPLFLDGDHPATQETIDGKTYSVADAMNAGAGNRYEETVYAIPGTNLCMAVRYAIHYNVLQNYPAGTKEFDRQALLNQFNSMRNSLSYTR